MNDLTIFGLIYIIVAVIGLMAYLAINYLVIEKWNRKFTILPSIPLYTSLKKDPNFSKVSVWTTVILYSVVYLPMTTLWIPSWIVWKLCMFLVKGTNKLKIDNNEDKFVNISDQEKSMEDKESIGPIEHSMEDIQDE